MADLKAAGLNPLLSVNKGASTPTAPMATMENSAKGVGEAARAVMLLKAQIDNIKADTDVKQTTAQNNAEIWREIQERIKLLKFQQIQTINSAEGQALANESQEFNNETFRSIEALIRKYIGDDSSSEGVTGLLKRFLRMK